MSFEIGIAANASDLLNKLNAFLTSKGKAYAPSFSGSGNGKITAWDGGTASLAETFTLTATSATAFSVVGSASGNLGTTTVGTPFAHAKIGFTLTAGTIPFLAGDAFRINTATPWTSLRAVPGSEMIWKAPGHDGLRQIYAGAKLFSHTGADYFNWRLQGFTGFSPGNDFLNQPGQLGLPSPVLTLWNSTLPYWFVANGQRVVVFARVGTVYVCAYLGLINTYLSPGQYPYPLFVGGNLCWANEPASSSVAWRYSHPGVEMHAFWRGLQHTSNDSRTMTGRLRLPDGSFLGMKGTTLSDQIGNAGPCSIWPYANDGNGFDNIRENLDGSYPLLPAVLSSDRGVTPGVDVNTWGELDGLRATTGHANAPENTITEGLFTHVVFQDVFRTSKDCWCALRLD